MRLAARQRRGILPEGDVRQSHVQQGVEFVFDDRDGVEELRRHFHRHAQHVVDVFSLVADVEGLAVITLALAQVAGHVDIRQEMHLHLDEPVTLTGLAAPAAYVE